MSFLQQLRGIVQSWRRTAPAGVIGTVSLALLFLTVPRMFLDYVVFPLTKEAYILPQWRYRVFDAVLLAWCIDGLVAAVLMSSESANRTITIWKRRTVLLYAGGLAVLIGGVVLGTWMRGHGY